MQDSNVDIVKVVDSRINTKSKQTYALVEGSAQATPRNYPASSFSQSQITFSNVNPPDGLFVSKRVMMTVSFNIEFQGTCPAGSTLLSEWGHSISLRNLPVNKMIRVGNLQLNKNQISANISDDVKLHERLNFDKCDWIPSATYCDVSQDYDECTHENSNNINPLSTNTGDKKRRGDFPVEILLDTSTLSRIRLTVSEPIMMSPLSFGCGDSSLYFSQLTKIEFNATLNDITKSILSISNNNPSTFTRITSTILDSSLEFEYLAPSPFMDVEPASNYEYYPITRQQQNVGSVFPNVDTAVTTNTVILSSVPKMLYILVSEDENKKTEYSTDTYAEIKAISITLNGRSSELATASQLQLYAMSKKNGSDLTWEQFKGVHRTALSKRFISGVGSIIAVNLSEDIGLSNNQAAGMTATQNIQVKVTFSSLRVDAQPVSYTVYTYFVSDGLVTLTVGGGSSAVESVVSQGALAVVPTLGEGVDTSQVLDKQSNIGGSLGSWIKGSVLPWLKQHGPQILSIAKQVAPMVGLGCGAVGGMHPRRMNGCPYCHQVGMGLVGAGDCGGALVGGRAITKKSLKQLLR
jgi:hypothetical protein